MSNTTYALTGSALTAAQNKAKQHAYQEGVKRALSGGIPPATVEMAADRGKSDIAKAYMQGYNETRGGES